MMPEKTLYTHEQHWHEPRNANQIHAEEHKQAGFNQRLAVGITRAFGSIWAFYFLVAWMVIWMLLATLGVWLFAKDAYPFSFLLFLSNLIQLWALPVLAVGQAVLSRKAEIQADEQFATTMRTYHDTEQTIEHLSAQDQELLKQTEMLTQIINLAPHLLPQLLSVIQGGINVPLDPEAYKRAAYPLHQPESEDEDAQQPEPTEKPPERLSPLLRPNSRVRKPRKKRGEPQK